MKLLSLDCSDFKRIQAVHLEFKDKGLTIVGGDNKMGKSSALEAILFALGGEACRPVKMKREGSLDDAFIRLTFDDGLVVERSGKNAALKVTDSTGKKEGQNLLNALISKIAINLPKFYNAPDREKARILLELLGIGDELKALDEEEQTKYQDRTVIGRQYKQKSEAAKEMPFYADVPEEPVTATALNQELSEAMQYNADIQAALKRIEQSKSRLDSLVTTGGELTASRDALDGNAERQIATAKGQNAARLADIERRMKELEAEKAAVANELDVRIAQIKESTERQREAIKKQIEVNNSEIETLMSEIQKAETIDTSLKDIAPIQAKIAEIDDTNAKIRANKERKDKIDEATALNEEFEKLTAEIEDIRERRLALLNGVDLPYPGLSVKDFGDGPVITLNGIPWSDCSGAEQLIISAAIAFAQKPDCRFVLMDKFEQFDLKTLDKFEEWVIANDKQVIATRVSTGDECSFIIEDGFVKGQEGVVIDKSPIKRDPSMADFTKKATPSVASVVKETASESIGGGKTIEVSSTPSDAMARAKAFLAAKRAASGGAPA